LPFDLKTGIVRILAADGTTTSGTGFILSEKGIIATCSHVIQPEKLQVRGYPKPEKVEVIFRSNGQKAAARLLPQAWRAAEAEDVAFLQLEGPLPQGVEALSIGTSEGGAGHAFQTFGFPDQSPEEGIYGEGRLLDQTTILGIRVLQVKSSEITPGFSGAPVFDIESRRVVGMVTSIAAPDKFGRLAETAFITPAEALISIYPELVPSDVRPYMGLSPFTEEDAEFFFGRRRLVEGLEEALRARPRFLLVMGPSGSGKSSVVQAGLIPNLRKGSVQGSDRWGIIVARPADRPFDLLERAGLRGAYASLTEAARGWLTRNPGQEKLLLILDQFEEFLVTCPPKLRRKFWSGLKDLLDSEIEVSILAVMRDDFYSRFADDAPKEVLAWTQRGFFQVGSNLEYEELQEIIREPARRVGLHLEEGLTEVIINDVLESSREGGARAGRSTVLPLLEFALTQLWERRDQGLLTHRAYQSIGKVTGSLTSWADQVCRGLEKEGLGSIARRIFTDLVNLGDEAQRLPDSRRQRRKADFLHDENDEKEREAVRRVVQQLADARLVTTSLDKGDETVQIIHDSLIREWARLQRWLKKDRSFLAWERELEKNAREWRETSPGDISGRDEGRLLRGRRLEEAERWHKERERDLGEAEREFVEASLGLREREREKEEKAKEEKERTRRRNMAFLSFITIIALVFAGIAYQQKGQADAKTEEALARSLASQSEQMRDIAGSLTNSVLLAVESVKHRETFEGIAALRRGLALLPRAVFILKHKQQVRSIAFSPDGKILATGSDEGTFKDYHHGKVWLWSTAKGKKLFNQPLEHNDWVRSIAFSPDGRRLATGCDDRNVTIWDIGSGKELLNRSYNGEIYSVAFSPDGKRLAAGGNYSAVCIWNLSTNKTMDIPLPDNVTILSVAFSPDGKMLAAANNTVKTSTVINTVMIWNASTGDLMLQTSPMMHSDKIHTIAFSPDGALLATGCRDAKAKILNASTGSELIVLDHGNSVVETVAFSPDGKRLATACNDDNTFRIWDLSSQRVLARGEHDSWIRDIAFSPDGRWVATASNDGTAIVWDLSNGEACLNYLDSVSAIAFSPDGTKFASASNDSTAMVWNLSTGTLQFNLSHDGGVTSMVFSLDGKKLATGCRVGEARIWDASDGKSLSPWLVHNNSSVNCVAFSPDGTELATASGDNNATVWDTSTGYAIARLQHNADVVFVAFSPDGTKLATASCDSTSVGGKEGFSIIKVWNSSNWHHLFNYTMHGGDIFSMKFSPDGTRLAIGGQLGASEIIDMASGARLKNIRQNYYDVYDMNFSPDGTKLAVTGMDQMVWIYDAFTGKNLLEQKIGGYGKSVAFSPDGTKVAIACTDNIASILDAFNGKEILGMQHDDVYSVAFSPDGTRLATGSKDGTARIWTLDLSSVIDEACSRITFNMTRYEWTSFMDDPNSDCLTCPQEGSFNQSSIWPWGRRECQPCIGNLG